MARCSPLAVVVHMAWGGVGIQHAKAKITTDLTVKTVDGQEAHWIIEQRGGAWVQAKLSDVLRSHRIPLG